MKNLILASNKKPFVVKKIFSEKWWFIVCLLFLSLVYLTNLLVPLTGDAGKYAAISRNIVESGDWINLHIHQQAYDQKPHLIFWLGALSFHLFGISAFAFKLPILFFSMLGFYSTYRLGKFLYNKETGMIALLMLASSEIWILFSNDIHTDILMASATVFAVWQLMVFLKCKKALHFVLGFVGVGLAILSKGPIGLLVPAFAIGGHLLIQQNWKELFHPRWLLALPILALFFYPTVAGLYQQLGFGGLKFYFWENNVGRVSGEYKGNNNDLLFYFHTALYIWLPWSLVFFLSMFFEGKNWLSFKLKDRTNHEFFLLCGIVLFWLLISIARAKAPHFLLTISPLVAVLAANWLLRIFSENTRIKKIVLFIQQVLGLGLLLFAALTSLFLFPSGIVFWILWCMIALFILLFLFYSEGVKRIVLVSVLGISSFGLAMNLVLFPGMFSYHSTIPACQTFNRLAAPQDVLHSCNSIHRELFFYANKPGLYLEGEEQLMSVVGQPHTWLYLDEVALNQLKEKNIHFEYFFAYKHKSLTRQSIRFLNPKTREETLNDMYLVKIGTHSSN